MQLDDFLGTSIQYSEQQLLLLEQQHADDLQKTVEELIESGFLDSDYEESTDIDSEIEMDPKNEILNEILQMDDIETENETYETETEIETYEIETETEIEIEENIPIFEDQLSLSLYNESNMVISPRSPCPITPHISTTPGATEFDIPIEYLLNKILCDIKSLMILFILIIALPHIIYNNDNNNNNNNNNNNIIMNGPHYTTSIYWYSQINTSSKQLLNEEEDERDEYIDIERDSNNKPIKNQLIFDIISCTKDSANKIFNAKLTRHKLIIPRALNYNLQPGAGLLAFTPQQITIIENVKQILTDTYGKQFARAHALITLIGPLIACFVGTAAMFTEKYKPSNHQSINKSF